MTTLFSMCLSDVPEFSASSETKWETRDQPSVLPDVFSPHLDIQLEKNQNGQFWL